MITRDNIYEQEIGKFYVYGLYRPDKEDDGLFYIGKGYGKRIHGHRKEAKNLLDTDKKKSLKIRVIHYLWKLGLDFKEKILWDNLTEQDAFDIEIELISIHGRTQLGYGDLANMTDGGDGTIGHIPWNKGIPRTEEVKEKIRKKLIGRHSSEEVNKKKGRKGHPAHNKGIPHTDDHKMKISVSLKKRPFSKRKPMSEDGRRKRSLATKGRHLNLSEEQIERKRIRMMGNNFNTGHKHSAETRKKISESNKGKIMSPESCKKMSEAKKKRRNKDAA